MNNLEKMIEEWKDDPTPEKVESWKFEICTALSCVRSDLLPNTVGETYETSARLVKNAIRELKYLIEICEEVLKDA